MQLSKRFYDDRLEISYVFDDITHTVFGSITSGEFIFSPHGHAELVRESEAVWEELELLIILELIERHYDKNDGFITYRFTPVGEMYMRNYVQ
jgi:hypothetical protein